MRVPISAFIITKNEEARLSATIAALKPLADEVLVVDSGSTDRTVEIARTRRRHFTGGWKGFYFSLCYALMHRRRRRGK